MCVLVVDSFYPRPFVELFLDVIQFYWPMFTTHGRDDLMVVIQCYLFRPVLVAFSVQHKGVHRSLDSAWLFSFVDFFSSLLCRAVYVCFDILHGVVFEIFGQLAERYQWYILLCLDLFLLWPFRFRGLHSRSRFSFGSQMLIGSWDESIPGRYHILTTH